MPHCEECTQSLPADQLFEDVDNKQVLCAGCAEGRQLVSAPPAGKLVLGREFDYGVSFSRKEGLKAGVRLGGARLSFEISPEELDKTLGPAR